jgi:hypothetical protein
MADFLDDLCARFSLPNSRRQVVEARFQAARASGAAGLLALQRENESAHRAGTSHPDYATAVVLRLAASEALDAIDRTPEPVDPDAEARARVGAVIEKLRAEGKTAHADALAVGLAATPKEGESNAP